MTDRLNDQPWLHEPDHVSVLNDGYHLVINRHRRYQTLNGYVGVTKDHPYFGLRNFLDEPLSSLEVHGGLTFANGGEVIKSVLPTGDESLWYFGFDCAHFGDYNPGLVSLVEELGGIKRPDFMRLGAEVYRDMKYVSCQLECLFNQLQQVQIHEHLTNRRKQTEVN